MPSFLDRFRLRNSSVPDRSSAKPFKEQGVAGYVIVGGVPSDNETHWELIGSRRWKTAQDMLANISIIAAGLRYQLNLTARPKWKLEPADESDEAKKAAEFGQDIIESTDRSWSRIVRNAAMYRYHGFGIQEWIASKRDDGKIGIQTIESRPQHTIKRWDTDANGGVVGVWQTDPITSRELYLPRQKIVYLVDDMFTDRPDGMGLFRHLVDPSNRLRQFLRLEGIGFQRDLTGIPVGRVPLAEINALVAKGEITQPQADAMIEGIRDFVSIESKSDTTGLIFDSATYHGKTEQGENISNVMKWGLELLTGEATNVDKLGEAVRRIEFEMALIIGVSSLLTGREGEGSRALSEDQSRNLYLTVNQTLRDMAEAFDRDVMGPVWAMNGLDEKFRPKLTTEDASFKDVEQIAATLQKMAAAGAVLAPDDPAINDVRNLMGISEAEEMSVEDLGLIRGAGKTPPGEEGGQSGGANDNGPGKKPQDAPKGSEQRRGSPAKKLHEMDDDELEKFNPHHVQSGEHGGEFTSASDSNGEAPAVGVPFIVYRAGRPGNEDLSNRNAGNATAVGVHLARLSDFESPKYRSQADPNELAIHAYKVSLTDEVGPYSRFNAGLGADWGGKVGFTTNGYGVDNYSFGTKGYSYEYLGSVPARTVLSELRDRHAGSRSDTFDDYGGRATGEVIRDLMQPKAPIHTYPAGDIVGSVLAGIIAEGRDTSTKYNPNHRGPGPGGGQFSSGDGGGSEPQQHTIPAKYAPKNLAELKEHPAVQSVDDGRRSGDSLFVNLEPGFHWDEQSSFGVETVGEALRMMRSVYWEGTGNPPWLSKFNPYHKPAGPGGGQFTSASGGGGGVIMVKDKLGNEAPVTENSSLAKFLVKNPDGTYSLDPAREALHQQIVEQFLAGVSPSTGQPTMYMTGGGPASGKSSILVGGTLPGQHDAVHVDPDAIKFQLPEFAEQLAAGNRGASSFVHEESSMVRKRLEAAAIAGNYNVVLDTTGDSSVDKLERNLANYRSAGYRVNAYYASNDVDLAIRLAHARGEKTGRYVPESFIRETHRAVSNTFIEATGRNLYDHVELYDTNQKGNPRLVAVGDRKSFSVKDQQLWKDFIAKGNGP